VRVLTQFGPWCLARQLIDSNDRRPLLHLIPPIRRGPRLGPRERERREFCEEALELNLVFLQLGLVVALLLLQMLYESGQRRLLLGRRPHRLGHHHLSRSGKVLQANQASVEEKAEKTK
jgi:hypothetical protein